MSRDVHSCTHLLRWDLATPPSPRIWTRITRALLVSKDRRHLFVTPSRIRNKNIFPTSYKIRNGTAPSPSPAGGCVPPPEPNKEGTHSPADGGGGCSNSDDRRNAQNCVLCGVRPFWDNKTVQLGNKQLKVVKVVIDLVYFLAPASPVRSLFILT